MRRLVSGSIVKETELTSIGNLLVDELIRPNVSLGIGGGKSLVLVVDDEVAARELLASYLDSKYRTVTTESGAEAVKKAQQIRPDAITLDVRKHVPYPADDDAAVLLVDNDPKTLELLEERCAQLERDSECAERRASARCAVF